jgi:hypothetical protein
VTIIIVTTTVAFQYQRHPFGFIYNGGKAEELPYVQRASTVSISAACSRTAIFGKIQMDGRPTTSGFASFTKWTGTSIYRRKNISQK